MTDLTARRHDLDWLRIIAFLLLIFYHIGMFYVTWDWHVKSVHASAFLEPAAMLRRKGELYSEAARAAGRIEPRRNIAASRIVYIAGSKNDAIEDLRAAVTHEISVQAERGFLKMLKALFDVEVPNDRNAIEALIEAEYENLSDLNCALIRHVCAVLIIQLDLREIQIHVRLRPDLLQRLVNDGQSGQSQKVHLEQP